MPEEYGQEYEQTQGGKGEGYPSPFASSQHAGAPAGDGEGRGRIADDVMASLSEDLASDAIVDADEEHSFAEERVTSIPRLGGTRGGRRLVKPEGAAAAKLNIGPNSGCSCSTPGGAAACLRVTSLALVSVSKHTLYAWKKSSTPRPGGIDGPARGEAAGSRLPELTKRTILMLKQPNPEWGCQRISDMLTARAGVTGQRVGGGVRCCTRRATRWKNRRPGRIRTRSASFERAKPNQLWQTDLFTFVLKRQNRRVYLVAFMDDHSRFIVSYGLHASQSSALVLEVLRAGDHLLRHRPRRS